MEQLNATPDAALQPKARLGWLKQCLLVGASVLVVMTLLNVAIWGTYHARAYPGVRVGGQNVGNLTRSAIVSQLDQATTNYELQISVKGQQHSLTAESLGLQYDNQMSAGAAIAQGKNFWLPLYGLVYTWNNGHVNNSYQIDTAKLNKLASSLAGTATVQPVDARVIVEAEAVRVEPDKPGLGLDADLLEKLITDSIGRGLRRAAIKEQATAAKIQTKQAEAIVPKVESIMRQPISLAVGSKSFTPGAAEIGKWLTVAPDKNGKLVVGTNASAMNNYISAVAKQLDVAAVTKQINMVNGVVSTVREGKDGLALDKALVAAALTAAVTEGRDQAVTGTMKPVAYKTRTNNTIDLNGKYVEINLSRQHLWAYDNKRLVYDTAITSGATGAGFPTIKGLFSIQAKQTNRYLNGRPLGYNYNVFVHYWMPFSGNYGLHDASWRSSFGGSDYYYGGSHGCVNLPDSAAVWVYNFVIVGTPVWVHS